MSNSADNAVGTAKTAHRTCVLACLVLILTPQLFAPSITARALEESRFLLAVFQSDSVSEPRRFREGLAAVTDSIIPADVAALLARENVVLEWEEPRSVRDLKARTLKDTTDVGRLRRGFGRFFEAISRDTARYSLARFTTQSAFIGRACADVLLAKTYSMHEGEETYLWGFAPDSSTPVRELFSWWERSHKIPLWLPVALSSTGTMKVAYEGVRLRMPARLAPGTVQPAPPCDPNFVFSLELGNIPRPKGLSGPTFRDGDFAEVGILHGQPSYSGAMEGAPIGDWYSFNLRDGSQETTNAEVEFAVTMRYTVVPGQEWLLAAVSNHIDVPAHLRQGTPRLSFPALSKYLELRGPEAEFDPLVSLVSRLERENELDSKTLPFFDLQVPTSRLASIGIVLLVLAQGYLLISMRHLRKTLGSGKRTEEAWFGLHDDQLSVAAFLLSICALPIFTGAIIAYQDMVGQASVRTVAVSLGCTLLLSWIAAETFREAGLIRRLHASRSTTQVAE